MKKCCKLINYSFLIVATSVFACNPVPGQEEEKSADSNKDLQEQSESLGKALDNINDAMDLAKLLNEKIQLVESEYEKGRFSREKADGMIRTLNESYKITTGEIDPEKLIIFPAWLADINITEPQGLTIKADESYLTSQESLNDGYNSILFIYNGNYNKAISEAGRIAGLANIPLSKQYQEAKDLEAKLGHKIDGVKGISYVNYDFGDLDPNLRIRIAISVDENGKLIMHIVDEARKNSRRQGIRKSN